MQSSVVFALTMCFLNLHVFCSQISSEYKNVKVLSYHLDGPSPDGYNFGYETSDGQTREEYGKIVKKGNNEEVLQVEGSYSYKGVDGRIYRVIFTAGEEGYKPKVYIGDHIPTAALASLTGGLG
ncbi:unnamed protein product [Brassicogethes aeneus]|uniref:Uncharacterized protein n=1 Tax=Brassicogethes aeneus TaxID=1431903 RepID=A0A9P0BB22_BRAAE|nr:unnamed protein product [Brassicogethes aeneus]